MLNSPAFVDSLRNLRGARHAHVRGLPLCRRRATTYAPGIVNEPLFPGAVPPDRRHTVDSLDVTLNLLEWGDPLAPPLLLCHGMWDHARSFALVAPLLARRYRVLALDARGHGDSGWANGYSWLVDVADIINVAHWIGRELQLIGHSKAGGQVVDAARALPGIVNRVVNIDGFGPPPFAAADEPTPERCVEFLDGRRRLTQQTAWRPYKTLDELIERRRQQNPRLSRGWLQYFLFHGAREDDDGWRWKVDPLAQSSFGPWRPEWIAPEFAQLQVPMLAMVGSEQDTWGPLPDVIRAERLAGVRQVVHCTIAAAGHFPHIERPEETADAIMDFLHR
jgi:pimeloyl-ACP methyl ester carboxylesterase